MNPPDEPPPDLPIDPTTFAFRLINRPVNRVEGFEHGAQARAYLRRCAEQTGLWLEAPERDEPTLAAMKAAGYASWDKFTRHLRTWHDLARPIPRAYGNFIGVRQPELLAVVELDRQDHERALATAPTLYNWTLRRMAGVYEVRPFPADCQSELDYVVYVGDACAHHGLRACIHIRGLKTSWFEPPEGEIHVTLYTPSVKITRAHITFADDGCNEGTMRAV